MHYLEGMRKSLAVLIVGVFLFSAFSVAGNSISDTTNLIEDNSADMLVEIIEQGEVEVLGDEPLLQPRENTVADRTPNEYPNSGQLVKVAIATTNVKELATFLSDVEYNGLIGTNSNQAGMAVPILDVPIDCIAGISSLPSTIAVYEPNERVKQQYEIIDMGEAAPIMSIFAAEDDDSLVKHHNADEAWANGFTGAGVKVGIADTGIDFANIDLMGSQAIFDVSTVSAETLENKSYLEYYDGWPIAFDESSMEKYLSKKGFAEDIWFADTSAKRTIIPITEISDSRVITIDGDASDWLPEDIVANDPAGDMTSSKYDVTTLYVASDFSNDIWYFALDVSGVTNVNVTYSIAIDTNLQPDVGANVDPLDRPIIFDNYLPERMITTTHYANDTFGDTWFNHWDGEQWSDAMRRSFDNPALTWLDYQYDPVNKFIEFSGEFGGVDFRDQHNVIADKIAVSLFTSGPTSNAQDTCPPDPAVTKTTPDLGSGITKISTMNVLSPYSVDMIQFDDGIYNVTGIDSLSGVYHIGYHPDENTYREKYETPDGKFEIHYEMGVLVVDSLTGGGEYDTVYVDMSGDKAGLSTPGRRDRSFANEKLCDKSSPIAYFDFYNATDSSLDYSNWNTGDGIPDASGGMVYFLPSSEIVTDEWVVTAGEKSNIEEAPLSVGNISVPNEYLLYKNGVEWLPEEILEEMVLESAIGDEEEIELVNDNIDPGTLTVFGTNVSKSNETVFEMGGSITNLFLINRQNTDIINFTLYVYLKEESKSVRWRKLVRGPTDNYTYGLDSANDVWKVVLKNSWSTGDLFYAFYNYTGPMVEGIGKDYEVDLARGIITPGESFPPGARITADYFWRPHVIDAYTGMISFTFPLDDGDNITADYQFNGKPIPYSEEYCERNGVNNYYPGNGALVAFMGEFDRDREDIGESHGTMCASAIVGGNTSTSLIWDGDYIGEINEPKGIAPDAKIIPIANIYNTYGYNFWWFSVEGYDGVPGTGDEAQILSNSFGYIDVHEDGWDFDSRLADYLTMEYANGSTVFTVSAGNEGYGYGTISSPASSPGVISAGAGTDMFYRNLIGEDGGPNPTYGEVAPFSSRGPGAMGTPDPDVIAIGDSAYGSLPLFVAPNNTVDGSTAATLWSGTSLSSPITSGILALVYDAFYQANNRFPNATEAQSLIKSSAENMNYDIFSQGAGYLNADAATQLANDEAGLMSLESSWVPGTYLGQDYDVFAQLLSPGDSDEQIFEIENHDQTDSSTMRISDDIFKKIGTYEYEWTTGGDPYNKNESWNTLTREDLGSNASYWDDAQLIKVTAHMNSMDMDPNYDLYPDPTYFLRTFDWTDVNGNGMVDQNWTDGTGYEHVGYYERNQISMFEGRNILQTIITDPAQSLHNGLLIGVIPETSNMQWLNWTISLEFFNRVDWDWVNTPSTLTVDADSKNNFTATIDVPDNAGLGTYEGAIYLDHDVQECNETLYDASGYPITTERFFNTTDRIANLSHGISGLNLYKMSPTGSFQNESMVYQTEGDEGDTPWGFYLPNGNITGDVTLNVFWDYSRIGEPTWSAWGETSWLTGTYIVDNDTGYVTLTDSGWWGNPDTMSWWKIYAWYNYSEPTLLTYPADYELFPENGTVMLDPAQALTAGEYLRGETYDIPAPRLSNNNLLVDSLTLWVDGAEMDTADYSVNWDTGTINIFALNPATTLIIANYSYYAQTITIPVAATVSGINCDFSFGGATTISQDMYNNSQMSGGMWDNDDYAGGDWRFYYVYIPEQGSFNNQDSGYKMVIDLNWTAIPTDIDIMIYAKPNIGAPAENFGTEDDSHQPDSDRYGPYYLEQVAKSEAPAGTVAFYTSTGGSEEILAGELRSGLNLIVLHCININGTEINEDISAKGGWIKLSEEKVVARTNELAGQASVEFISNMDWDAGITASVLGPAISEMEKDLEVWQEGEADMIAQDEAITWRDYIFTYRYASYFKFIEVEKASTLEVEIWDQGGDDLDLAIFYDVNGDDTIDWEDMIHDGDYGMGVETTGQWSMGGFALCADADGNEHIKLILPPDGKYIIAVYGWGVTSGGSEEDEGSPPALFDMKISMIVAGVAGYGLDAYPGDDTNESISGFESNVSLKAFTIQQVNVTWSFPGGTPDGGYGGIVYIGPGNAPGLVAFAADIILDTEAPEILGASPAPYEIINIKRPEIIIQIEDLERAEVEGGKFRMALDGVDVTSLARISAVEDEEFGGSGYPRGMMIYRPSGPLEEGGHEVEVYSADWTGNEGYESWVFTVDTIAPEIELNRPDLIYTGSSSTLITGMTEPDTVIKVSGGTGIVDQKPDGYFTIDLMLFEGENSFSIKSTDIAGNTKTVSQKVIYDTDIPVFDRVVALDGTTTNKRVTGIYGEITEPGTLLVDGNIVLVNSDGTFKYENVELLEGPNMVVMEFTDVAGNTANNYMNITLDTAAPELSLTDIESIVYEEQLNVSGITDLDVASLTINGKLVSVDDGTGDFQNAITLSPGTNTIVIESKDRAGNSVQEIMTVSYMSVVEGTNWAAISVMIVLLVVGLVLGLMFGGLIGGKAPAEESVDDMPPEELDAEEIPEDGLPLDEEIPEDGDIEEVSEDVDSLDSEDMDSLDSDEPLDEEMPSEDIPDDAEPIPAEEGMPEDLPEEETLDEEPVDISEEITSEEADLDEPEVDAEEVPEVDVEEDPRIVKLREAFESGKISEELYEKNLARFKDQ